MSGESEVDRRNGTMCVELLTAAGVRERMARSNSSVAHTWMENLLCAIRRDSARPTVHARNLYHVSLAMYDAWAAYDWRVQAILTKTAKSPPPSADENPSERRWAVQRAVSLAAYRVLRHRFSARLARGSAQDRESFDALLSVLVPEYGPEAAATADADWEAMVGAAANASLTVDEPYSNPVAFGLRCGQAVVAHGLTDGAREWDAYNYAEGYYVEKNARLVVYNDFNSRLAEPDHWQRLSLGVFRDQSETVALEYPPYLGPHWGHVTPFGLINATDASPDKAGVWFDPGPPPRLADGPEAVRHYAGNFTEVLRRSSQLDPADGVSWDIGPASRGRSALGTNDGRGRSINPVTRQPYPTQWVPRGDYARVLAEFWADGPDSETPPGHWMSMLNHVISQPRFRRRWRGRGPVLAEAMDWDVRAFVVFGGALHDAAIAAWGTKHHYDFVRPVSAIRYLWNFGQSSDRSRQNYNPKALPLVPGLIEQFSTESAEGRHAETRYRARGLYSPLDYTAIRAWRGGQYFTYNAEDTQNRPANATPPNAFGVGWILGPDWWPYQRPSFVTPPFPGYVSGHSTFSRAAADTLAWLTGSHYWPGGVGTFDVPANEFLVFERGPSQSLQLQWATYRDAADETALSRIWGGHSSALR